MYKKLFKIVVFINLVVFSGRIEGLHLTGQSYEAEKATGADIHGFFDFVFKNDYMTPRGLLVTDNGLTMQILAGLVLDVYKNPDCDLNKISINFGVWNDLWTAQHNPKVGSWNELDWFVGLNFSFLKDWKFSAGFTQFLSPPGNFKPENNMEFTLYYDDSRWKQPVVFNPYLKLFWTVSGDSTIVVGADTFYVEFGAIPTYEVKNFCFPMTLSMPTWFSVGPSSFWDGGELALKHKECNFGVFSTGLLSKFPLKFIPASLGNWYLDAGVQYYYLINDNLLQAQVFTLNLSSYHHAHRNVVVGYGGFGFDF